MVGSRAAAGTAAAGRRTGTPYRGLARFEQQDARWFFGREDVTEHLVALAAESSALPLVLVGPSGAGKSSLLRAGLLPRLSELAAVAPEIAGPVIVLEPTATPVADLKARLAELAAGPEGAEGGRPAVIVDQFEAVFTRVPRRGAAPRLHHRAMRTGRDRASDPGAAG